MNFISNIGLAISFLILVHLGSSASAHAQGNIHYQVVHGFGVLPDGEGLWSSVISDAQGNIYGTTVSGGTSLHMGTVFELSPNGSEGWAETVLHNFTGGTADGLNPYSGLAFGSDGVLYGTTSAGGNNRAGTAYSLTSGSGTWNENVLWNFGGNMGVPGYGSVILDKVGNVYGSDSGIYELSPGDSGWTYKSICAVQFCPTYGIASKGGVVFAASRTGGTYGGGSVFELTPGKSGWQERTLYNFGSFPQDGQTPVNSPLVADSKGNIYGATFSGGSNNCGNGGCGTVYKLTRGSNGQYTETILYNFQTPSAGTGFNPVGGVILDNAGSLYGTTGYGGTGCGCGVVFRLSPNKNGTWTYAILHNFENTDGDLPAANLTFDSHGNLFGTTVGGGPNGGGVVFEISRQ